MPVQFHNNYIATLTTDIVEVSVLLTLKSHPRKHLPIKHLPVNILPANNKDTKSFICTCHQTPFKHGSG